MKDKISVFGYLVSFLFVLLPFITSKNLFYGAINSKYFFIFGVISILFLFFSYVLFYKKEQVSIKGTPLLLIGFLTLVFYYISAWFGSSFSVSFWSDILRSSGLLFLTAVFLFAFVLANTFTKKDWSLVRRSIALSGAFFAFLTFFGAEGLGLSGQLFNIDFTVAGLTFDNSTFAGTYLVLSLIVALIEIFNLPKQSGLRKVLVGSVFVYIFSPLIFNADVWLGRLILSDVLSSPALLLGDARSSSATVFLLIFFLLGVLLFNKLKFSFKNKLKIGWALSFVGFIFISIYLLFSPGSFVQEAYIKESTAARIITWEAGLSAVKDKPLLGFGPENFRFAFEQNFDNRLFLKENLGEIWFDRAHNIIVESLVTVGYLGSALTLFVVFYFLFVVYRARKQNLIPELEAFLWGALVFVHFLQMQTAFDTVTSYVLLGIFFAYGLWLEDSLNEEKKSIGSFVVPYNRLLSGVFILLVLVFAFLNISYYEKQASLVGIFRADNSAKQVENINKALDWPFGFESLRLASSSMIKGGLESISSSNGDPQTVALVNSQIAVYLEKYEDYISNVPTDYRARVNYVYLSLLRTAFGENRLKQAEEEVSVLYELSPNHPLTYIMDSLVSLYSGDVSLAEEKINQAIALNKKIEATNNIKKYIEIQKQNLPEITIIKLENL